MAITYKKKNENTLIITNVISETHITEEERTEIQTKIDRLEINKTELQKRIDELQAKKAILDGV